MLFARAARSTLRLRWLLLKCSAIGIGFNGAETSCRIAHILGILLMNSCYTDIFFSNYYHLQSVRFELRSRRVRLERNPLKRSWQFILPERFEESGIAGIGLLFE